jgi:signal transduction histidine kinase
MTRWAFAGLLLLALLVASLSLLLSVREASRWVKHTDETRVALLNLESVVVDAEAGARGYAASGDRVFLEPYTSAVASHQGVFDAVRSLTVDNAAQHRRLAALQPVIEQEFGILEALIDAHTHGVKGEKLVPLLARGKQVMDDIRQRIADLLHEEEHLDLQRVRSESTKISVTFGVLLTAVIVLVASALWFANARRLEHRVRERERQAREQAERASKFAELFVAVLGHDLRNPLGAITTSGSLLANHPRDEREERIASRILASSQRMARMIDQILDFSRIRAGHGLVQKPAPMDLRELIGRVRDELPSGSSIKVDAEGATDGVWDCDRLAQVFSNLLGNALEHSPEGAAVHVDVDGRPTDRVEITVQNPGAIPAEVMPEVFEPFRQGRQQGSPRGVGLGLYISKEIVAAHGGSIGVTSSESLGTRFQVRLPRAAPERDDAAARGLAS